MKKILIALLLVFIISTSCYAVNIIDTVVCKKVVLCANHVTVLVNRITGEVKYVHSTTVGWVFLTGVQKTQFQSMYDAQTALKLVCH